VHPPSLTLIDTRQALYARIYGRISGKQYDSVSIVAKRLEWQGRVIVLLTLCRGQKYII